MQDIYKSVEKADVLVFATPVYVFNMTGQLKTFLDRLYAVDYNTLLNKKIVLLSTYELQVYENDQYKKAAYSLGADILKYL